MVTLTNSFCEASEVSIPKPGTVEKTNQTKISLQTNIPYEY